MPHSLLKRLQKNRTTALSALFLLLITLLALFAPYVTHFSYEEQNIIERLQTPSFKHWMGTDTLGRDLYSRIIYGARISLSVGILTAFSALVFGTLVGSFAGYFGGWIDTVLMSIVELFYIFPTPLLAILLMLVLGRGFVGIFLALSMTAWVNQARLVRNLTFQTKELPYVEAARAIGLTSTRVIFRHVIPNIQTPMIAFLTLQVPANIMAESFLSFIGLGLQPPLSSWGTLAQEGFRAIQSFPHLIVYPGGVLFFTLLALNFLGDGLNESVKLMGFDHKG